jgi:SAM-dependent methyltransferase
LTAHNNGLNTWPEVVAELGPGRCLGLGFCALLSGATKYHSFDIVKYIDEGESERVFRELVYLFKKREKIPNGMEFPDLQPNLNSYEFPEHILSEDRLKETLRDERLEAIADAIRSPRSCHKGCIEIRYFTPWHDTGIVQDGTVDMLCSQFVLEHVDDLPGTYQAMSRWLKPGGVMSHFIDFQSHVLTKDWNGHWTCSDDLWSLIRGKRPYMLNREPHSSHLGLMKKLGFEVVCDIPVRDFSGVGRDSLAPRYKNYLSPDDLITSGAMIQAVKRRS